MESNDSLAVDQSAGDGLDSTASGGGHDSTASPVVEVDSLAQQPSPHLVQCSDDALASAENENNLNVESENNSVENNRLGEASDIPDVVAAEDNSENLGDSRPGDRQGNESLVTDEAPIAESSNVLDVSSENVDSVADLELGGKPDNKALWTDQTPVAESSNVSDVSAEPATDICEIESAEGHPVLSSCSAMIIDVQDHEFSDEEIDVGKSEITSCLLYTSPSPRDS